MSTCLRVVTPIRANTTSCTGAGAQSLDAVGRLELALGLAFTAAFAIIVVARLFYPFELSWMESAMQQMTTRRLEGQSIYAPPSLEYVPCLYPPLYFEISAALATLVPGPDETNFFAMRFVSITSCVGLFALTMGLLRRQSATVAHSFSISAVLLATYGRFECWQDNSRVDSLYCLLLVSATALLIATRGARTAIASGVCYGLAILTKQPAAVMMALSAVQTGVVHGRWRRATLSVSLAVVTVIGYLAATGELGNPAFYHYVFAVPASHPLRFRLFVRGVFFLPATLPFLWWVGPVWLLSAGRRRAEWREAALRAPWSLTLILWLVPTLLLRAKQGASINFFMPLVPIALLAFAEAERLSARTASRVAGWLPLFPCVQLLALAYDPRPFVPTPSSVVAARSIVARLGELEGPVWFPAFPSYAALAGKPWLAQEVPLADLRKTDPAVSGRLVSAIRSRAFGALVLPPDDPLTGVALAARYRREPLPEAATRFLSTLHQRRVESMLVAPSR